MYIICGVLFASNVSAKGILDSVACNDGLSKKKSNPFLELKGSLDEPFPYDILTVEAAEEAFPDAVEIMKERVAAVKASKNKPNFKNTIQALREAFEALDLITNFIENFTYMATTPELQALSQVKLPEAAKLEMAIFLDADLFARVKDVYDRRMSLRLSREQMTILEEFYRAFVKNGAALSRSDKDRIQEIDSKIVLLSQLFDANLQNASNEIFVTVTEPSRLAGLPEDSVAAAKQLAITKNQPDSWLFSLQASSVQKVWTYAQDRSLREEVWHAYSHRNSKPPYDNSELLIEIAQLRQERAQILGYKDHAHFVTEDRMSEVPDNVLRFIEKLREKYRPAAEQEARDLQKFAEDQGVNFQLMSWDVPFYSNKLLLENYAVDSQQVRAYFTLEAVHQGSLRVAEQLYKIKFTPKKATTWDPSVLTYEVHDSKNGKFLGFFYFDPYSRQGKKSGAWHTTMLTAGEWSGQPQRPHVLNVLNISPPTGDQPSLLNLGEVRTVFHELGHGLHSLLTKTRYRSVSGTQVARDFVELPSQLNETWVLDPKTLQSFARHYKTGEVMPLELIQKIKRTENFRVGSAGLGQLRLGALDMAWHSASVSSIRTRKDLENLESSLSTLYSVYPSTGTIASTAFSHIFSGGYSAGYYSYKWSDALVADAFEYFSAKGIYNARLANSYRHQILSKGGSEKPALLYRRFRGQEPDPDALLRREGLLGGPD